MQKPSGVAANPGLPAPLPRVLVQVVTLEAWGGLFAGLRELGFQVHQAGQVAAVVTATSAVVHLVDGSSAASDAKTPFIVIALSRSAQVMNAAIEAGASGYFVAPIEFLSLSAAICAAASKARDLTILTERTAKLNESLTADQTVSTVVGILMERYRFRRSDAYERLRRYSRSERRKVVDVATQIVVATEELGQTMRAIESAPNEV